MTLIVPVIVAAIAGDIPNVDIKYVPRIEGSNFKLLNNYRT
ncbi:hypothetical protein OSCI_2980010 [Kamptonema sp. PCC 6506]|nr:hypothetical protein OSCI_2980010 [Kamptonema sp. PCC 6506]